MFISLFCYLFSFIGCIRSKGHNSPPLHFYTTKMAVKFFCYQKYVASVTKILNMAIRKEDI